MAEIAARLLEFPPEHRLSSSEEYDKRIKAFIASLNQIPPTKLASADADQDLLEVLDPFINSLSFLFVLWARISGHGKAKAPSNDTAHVRKAIEFLNNFDGVQIRYVGAEFAKLVDYVVFLPQPLHSGVLPAVVTSLCSAILRLDPSSGTLTSNHLTLLALCLQTRRFRDALPVLEKVIHSFPANKTTNVIVDGAFLCSPHSDSSHYITEASGLTAKLNVSDVHEYFLCGALIYIGLHEWENALLYLECVLTSPTQGTPSGLMLEAYQKWILVGCLVYGHAPDIPKGVNTLVIRTLSTCSKAYDALGHVYKSGDLRRLQAETAAGSNIWHENANLGLVQQLKARLPRFYVLSLPKTYAAIPLTQVANWLQEKPDAVHAFVEELISTGSLNASIDLRDGPNEVAVLRFFSNQNSGPLAKSEDEYYAKLVVQTARTTAMVDYVKMADRRLMLTKEYIDSLRKRMRSKDEDGPAGVDMDTTWDTSAYLDEDLMLDS